jgi:general secretion pathway protein J
MIRWLQCKKGFTLIELIISFSILALIIVIVLGALRLGYRFWDKGEEVALENQEQRMVWSSLRHQLCSIYPYQVKIENKKFILFEGERDKIAFVSLFSYYLQDKGGLRYCQYRIEKDEREDSFSLKVFETKTVNADLGELNISDERFKVLVRGLPPFVFEYADQNKTDESFEWFSAWKTKEKKKLPEKIRFVFKERYRNMEELLFALRSKGYDFQY